MLVRRWDEVCTAEGFLLPRGKTEKGCERAGGRKCCRGWVGRLAALRRGVVFCCRRARRVGAAGVVAEVGRRAAGFWFTRG